MQVHQFCAYPAEARRAPVRTSARRTGGRIAHFPTLFLAATPLGSLKTSALVSL
jgi:hypothetical protein